MQCNHLLAYIYWRNRNDSLSCFKYILMSQDCSLRISGRICFKNQGWYRVLNSWKSLEICLDLDKSGNWEIKSEKKIVISSEFFFQSYNKCFLRELMFLFLSNLIQSRPQVCSKPWKKSFVPVLFLRSLLITDLFDNLESGKRNYCLKKSLEKVLNSGSKNLCKPCKINHLFHSSNWTVINYYENKLSGAVKSKHTHTKKKQHFLRRRISNSAVSIISSRMTTK